MNEIEKMYKNAGVEKSKCWDDCTTCTRTSCDKTISYIKAEYPPFTAEKQIELIKWLCIKNEFNCYQNKVTKEWIIFDYEKDCTHITSFDECLASWINYIWQDLTEEEKQQVKGILK